MGTSTVEETTEVTQTPEQLAEEEAAFQEEVDHPTDLEGTPETPAATEGSTDAHEDSSLEVGDPPVKEGEESKETVATTTAEVVEEDVPAKISQKEFERLMKNATTVEEMKVAIDQRFDSLAGKLGGIERYFKDGGKGKSKVTKEHLKELMDKDDEFSFPELGERLIPGLNRWAEELGIGGSGLTQEQVEAILDKREVAREVQRIAKVHKDWATICGPAFEPDAPDDKVTPYWRWVRAQGAEEYQRMYESKDHAEINASITKYKESLTAPAPKTVTTPVTPKKTGPSEREQVLRRGVQPRSAGGPSVKGAATDEDAAMREGYLEEEKQRST